MSLRQLAACPVAEAQLPGHAQGPKGAKAFEKAEDPIYALEHNLPIDAQHYLDHHLEQPLMRIFEPIMRNPKDLLRGVLACGLSAAGRVSQEPCRAMPELLDLLWVLEGQVAQAQLAGQAVESATACCSSLCFCAC